MWRFILLFAFVLSACAAPFAAAPTCAEQAGEQIKALQSIAREWDDAYKLAAQTPRASLSGQIAALQAIRRKAQDLEMPECASTAKLALVDSMDNSINGFIAFLGQKPETEVQALFARANDRMKAFGEAVVNMVATPVP